MKEELEVNALEAELEPVAVSDLVIEELEQRAALEVHGACACTCSCDCTSCSCIITF
jgi:hypothetical protein